MSGNIKSSSTAAKESALARASASAPVPATCTPVPGMLEEIVQDERNIRIVIDYEDGRCNSFSEERLCGGHGHGIQRTSEIVRPFNFLIRHYPITTEKRTPESPRARRQIQSRAVTLSYPLIISIDHRCYFFRSTLSPIFSSRLGMVTLPSVEAMIIVFPEADGPNSFERSTLMVNRVPSTVISTFFMLFL